MSILKHTFNVDASIVGIMYLQILNLCQKNITQIPSEMGQFVHLQWLCLSFNDLIEIKFLTHLVNLKTLILSHNKITKIPYDIKQLVNLETLALSFNKIKVIPREIGQLINLETLNLSYNKIKVIPTQIIQLVNLEKLSLYRNQIMKVSLEISNGLQNCIISI